MAERNLSIRLSVVDGGKVKAELSEIGEKGERSLKKIESAATPASSGLKLLSSAANDAKFQLQAATDRLGMLGSVLGKLGPAGLIAGASIAALVGTVLASVGIPLADTIVSIGIVVVIWLRITSYLLDTVFGKPDTDTHHHH